MSLTYSDVNTFVLGHLEKAIVLDNKWHSRCPFCLDSKNNKYKKRFWITYKDEDNCFFHCFNCDAKGTFYDLYSHFTGASVKEAYDKFRQFDSSKIRKRFIRPEEANVVKTPEKPQADTFNSILDECVKTPEGLIQGQLQRILEAFRKERQIAESYPLFIACKGKFDKRVIIPVMDGKDIVFFQGRAITKEMYPKYLNPTVEKTKIILNKDFFDKNKYIIVTEGLIDAMSVEDHQGTSCLGASVKEEFLTELTKYTDRGIIIALDNDPTGYEKLEVFLENNKFSNEVKYFMMPDEYHHIKDLNQLKTETSVDSIYDYVVQNSFEKFKTLFRLKMKKKNT